MDLVTMQQIEAAARLLAPVMRRTPMVASRAFSDRCGHEVWLKCENLQRTGSFKPRGAYVRISGLSPQERARGVVAASAGNHAQGVAWAATELGIASTVFMPTGAALPKVMATKAYGAKVHLVGAVLEETLEAAQECAAQTGAVMIHPFDHLDVVAGQATVGLEIIEQLPEVGTILVSAGGGGLVSGIAAAARALRPEVRIVAVQAERAAAWPASLAAGRPVRLASMSTMADGIAVGLPGQVTYAHVERLVDDVVTVSEEALSRALLLCLERAKLLVEPAGSAAVAALLSHTATELGLIGQVCAVLSGGNIDPLLLGHVITHGLQAGGRYLAVRVTIPDRPGGLVRLLTTVSAGGASVVDVAHSRTSGRLELGDVEVLLTLETRGPDHRSAVLAAMTEAGYTVDLQD